jgi:hypothetical protein
VRYQDRRSLSVDDIEISRGQKERRTANESDPIDSENFFGLFVPPAVLVRGLFTAGWDVV